MSSPTSPLDGPLRYILCWGRCLAAATVVAIVLYNIMIICICLIIDLLTSCAILYELQLLSSSRRKLIIIYI